MREKGENKKGPIAVTRSSLPPLEEYVEMLKPLWESAWLTNMGDYHEEFKRQLKVYLKAQNLELFVNAATKRRSPFLTSWFTSTFVS